MLLYYGILVCYNTAKFEYKFLPCDEENELKKKYEKKKLKNEEDTDLSLWGLFTYIKHMKKT